jgi:integrase
MEDLLLQTQRVLGTRKPITIVNPIYYNEFFKRLRYASGVSLTMRALIGVALSGGLRVSEALSLRPCDFQLEEGFFKVRVLKKRKTITRTKRVGKTIEKYTLATHKVYRECKLHPLAIELIREYLESQSLKHFEHIFNFTRKCVHDHIRKMFGPHACPHSIFRHSHISWLLHEKKTPDITVASIMELSPRIVANYSHANRKAELEKIYEES